MCLYPKLRINKKYVPNKKNGGNPPKLKDARLGYVPTGCGKCMECKKQKGRQWSVRLQEEVRNDTTGKYITLTFSNESINELVKAIDKKTETVLEGYDLDNEIATIATRRFLERWRKEFGTSVKHWLITELGHKGTENIHLHGIIWTKETFEKIRERWTYGHIWPTKETQKNTYVSAKTVNYIIKYVTKIDQDHKEYNPKILTSAGIGKSYLQRPDAEKNKYKENGETDETYKTRQGQKINMPIYLRNKIYTEEEREKLWIEKLNKQERFVDGIKVSTKENEDHYYKILESAREKNARLGYADDRENWEQKEYEKKRRIINHKKRLEKFDNNEKI